MVRRVVYTYDVGSCYVTVEIDVLQGTEEQFTSADGHYTAALTITPGPEAETLPGEITVTPVNKVTVTESNRQLVRKDAWDAAVDAPEVTYELTRTNPESRGVVEVQLSTPDGERTHTTHITLPNGRSLRVLRHVATTPELDSDDLADIVTSIYPQSNSKNALNRFNRAAEELLEPEAYLPLANMLVEACPPLRYYRADPATYVAKHGFGLQKRVYPNKPDDWYKHILDTYNDQQHLPNTTLNAVYRAALLRARLDRDDPAEAFEKIKQKLRGRDWHEELPHSLIGLVTVLLYDTDQRSAARITAGTTPTPVSEDEYEYLKDTGHTIPNDEKSTHWGKLLPLSTSISNDEFVYILGNTAFWLAGDVSIQDNQPRQASYLYSVAADLMYTSGRTRFMNTCRSREYYTEGLHHMHQQREDEAEEKFVDVLSYWSDKPNDHIDKYSYCGAIERLSDMWADELKSETDDTNVEDGLDTMQRAISLIPDDQWFRLKTFDRYHDAIAYINAVTAELTGVKLARLRTDDTPVPTVEQVDSQLTTAKDLYRDAGKDNDARRIAWRQRELHGETTTGSADEGTQSAA